MPELVKFEDRLITFDKENDNLKAIVKQFDDSLA